ncbi:hypothetical protein TWF225_012102 [Orbilia oligospora]|uniref:Uncharacterized protein n=1 Tax=Orbilia oligospora TaxID=2813651 RepID=A0A7C8P6P8_ORBOL|nr:hypothetical protein TWF751_012118 [Orbilia oligospora]KAF3174396.1 hypothetical protein TWF225_012102 [Orbilia oligospora]KAF3247784.1 hypothetical protein TWF217_012091 [Orbilia oligospora]KAF3258809.1 hypothetical protein TWF128_012087 [Orbilia oligospora]KAF3292780.1 hypothetical protein TWF132_012099 [Orbilia oligospora]
MYVNAEQNSGEQTGRSLLFAAEVGDYCNTSPTHSSLSPLTADRTQMSKDFRKYRRVMAVLQTKKQIRHKYHKERPGGSPSGIVGADNDTHTARQSGALPMLWISTYMTYTRC